MEVIQNINTIIDKFTCKIRYEHHKEMDGVWGMRYNTWHDYWQVFHNGYWLDDIIVEFPTLLPALVQFKTKLTSKIKEEIEHNKRYIEEIDVEMTETIHYMEQSMKTKKYLRKQIEMMENENK